MSNQSNILGRAYEYICLIILKDEIEKVRPVKIEETTNFSFSKECWEFIDLETRQNLQESAKTAILAILNLEPTILEKDDYEVILKLQKDTEGQLGDVRDIVITRKNINWEIGLSIKHNNFAVKHSRIAKTLDFGEKWFGIKCSENYWEQIKPIFSYLEEEKNKGIKWSELVNKEDNVYVPLLTAFMEEIKRSYKVNSKLPKKLVEYLLGEYDFYKIISLDRKRLTQIQVYNLRGTLNRNVKKNKLIIPTSKLPSEILKIDFKENSKNTVEMILNEGWKFSFRIHNASTFVETSLKFDIQIIDMPKTIITIDYFW